MARPSTPFRWTVKLSDVDRGVETELDVRTAQHPSETLERVWLRVLAYCWQWQEGMAFGGDLSSGGGPDLVAHAADGTPECVVMVGKPDLERVRHMVQHRRGARAAVLFESAARMALFGRELEADDASWLDDAELAAAPETALRWLASTEERRGTLGLTIAGEHLYMERGGDSFDAPLSRFVRG